MILSKRHTQLLAAVIIAATCIYLSCCLMIYKAYGHDHTVYPIHSNGWNATQAPALEGQVANKVLYVSSQMPLDRGCNCLNSTNVQIQAKAALTNLKSVVERSGAIMENVLKSTVFLKVWKNQLRTSAILQPSIQFIQLSSLLATNLLDLPLQSTTCHPTMEHRFSYLSKQQLLCHDPVF